MLRFDGVSFGYMSGSAINDVSFYVAPGEFVALLGENGAGKSTLCRLCNGLLKPSSGRVKVGGQDTRQVKTSVLSRSVGFLFQNPDRQICRNTVSDEIMFGLENVVASPDERRRRRDEVLGLFALDGDIDPFGMSRGERQQVALASVLATKPKLLILDEPTTGLDYRECLSTMEIVSRLNADGTTVLMVSHDMEVTADFAKRAIVLSGGRLIGDGPVREIMKNRRLLDEASLLPAQIPALAMFLSELGELGKPDKIGELFSDAFTVDDMVELTERANRAPETRQ
ncbi:MAG: energy-coupling factor ABC transporter ATP-binding protein [Synergistaceae bacterium]|jgi:energy-coupling factor transport system ATP-binding protein|nr:energy-coupling factor ABC transporter ATP-binding protein [Synergistaceae bacterium]